METPYKPDDQVDWQPREDGPIEEVSSDDAKKPEEHDNSDAKPSDSKPSKLKLLWQRYRPDKLTLILMFKGSLPPSLGIALFQARSFADHYTTIGYLVAIASVLAFCIMPRGKFIQTMFLNTLAVCLAAAMNLLALFCITQARVHTTPPGQPLKGYNSSASAVSAVWLVFFVYCINVTRAARPQLQFPAILSSIFSIVSLTYGVAFPDMPYAVAFIKKLLEAFLTGFGLATGVSLFIFPMSSRKVVMKEMAGYLQMLNGLLKLEAAFMASLEDADPVALRKKHREEEDKVDQRRKSSQPKIKSMLTATPESMKLKEGLKNMFALHTKLGGDITPAKREFAIGKLESHDFTELWKLLRSIFVPVMGLSTLMDIMERQTEVFDWDKDDELLTDEQKAERDRVTRSLHLVMRQLHGPFESMIRILDGAFQHVMITLELIKPPKRKQDEENDGGEPAPGTHGFAEAFKRKVDLYYSSKETNLRQWFHERGIELPSDFFQETFIRPESMKVPYGGERERRQKQLFFLLYLEHLLWRVSGGVLDLMMYVEKRKQDGAFKRSKLIFPGSRTLYKWFKSIWTTEDLSEEDSFTSQIYSGNAQSLYLGEDFLEQKDPEHLPPRNIFEEIGEKLRKIPKFFRSEASLFGIRVVAATMSIAIINYLEASQTWFLEQRLLWAEIMVAISMSRTAGQSTFNFALRILGTAIAMVASYCIWYIVDGTTGGVIILLWLWIFCAFYIVVKFPKIVIVGIISLVTSILIIGYELQVRVLGTKIAESNGQPAYPTYELAPYRLATVAGGLLVAFIWTIFPFPVSESTETRKDIAASLYLLSNYYSISHETVIARVNGIGGNEKQKGTHGHHLNKYRAKVFQKLILVLTNLRANANFGRFQLRVGGRFPHEEYDELIECCSSILQWSSLIVYTSHAFDHPLNNESTVWQRDFHALLANTNLLSHEITSLLALMSSSLHSGLPLPPYVQPPPPFELTKKLDAIDEDILSLRHIVEPEYSAFAVLQAATQYINADVIKVKKHVKNLVGEIDFSFHAKGAAPPGSDSASTDTEKVEDEGKL